MAQPANDDCSGAIELITGATCDPTPGSVEGATASFPGTVTCDGFQATPDDDVWYRFTATAASHQIRVTGSASFDAAIQLFSGGCSGSSILCRDLVSAGGTEVLDVSALIVGDEYLVRVFSYGATIPATTTFTICVTASNLPANDNCAGAITITPNPVCTPTTGTIASATNSAPASACGGSPNDDVWYKFVATAADHTIQVTTGSGFDAVVDLRSGACNGTSINCVDVVSSNSTENLVASGLNVGETYFVRVYHFGTNIPANLGLSICVLGPVPPDCAADAGTITADLDEVCYVEGETVISATPDDNEFVPAGYEVVYVLTKGPGLLILEVAPTPDFLVAAEGGYTIHTLVYDPNTLDLGLIEPGVTTGFDVDHLLLQGGGVICGSLDVVGAPVTVLVCATCDAVAGTITANEPVVCLVDGMAMFSATQDGNSVVPTGFETVFVLTEGAGLVIVDVAATPDFMVTTEGSYTIHTLVYDPTTLDLGLVEIGVTTGFDVNALLIQGGGAICGSLDVTGAPVTVEVCLTCDAFAGTITADASVVCLVDDMAVLTATPNGDIVIPAGFETIYVLTKGVGLLIMDAASSPDFMVTAEGDYTIHTLVYDPNTLDISLIEFGVTTGFDVNALLIQGGGTICASLDVVGAPVAVQICVACEGGDVTTSNSATSVNICQDGEADVIDFATSSTSTNNYTYVLTDDSDRIVTLLSGNALDFNSAAVGVYHVWGVSYDGNLLGADVGADIADLTNTGTCLELSASFVTVTVEICIGVAEADQLTWGLYPNPTEGLVTLNYRGADATVNIEVVDMGGRVVAQDGRAMTNGQRHTMDLDAFAPGMYTVRLTSGLQVTNLRVVVR